MTRKLRGKTDPFEREIEVALNPGAFIPEHAKARWGKRKAEDG